MVIGNLGWVKEMMELRMSIRSFAVTGLRLRPRDGSSRFGVCGGSDGDGGGCWRMRMDA